LKADFAGHALVGEGLDLGYYSGLVGLALQGYVGQLIEPFYLSEGRVEVENQVGQGSGNVGHGCKDGRGATLPPHSTGFFMKLLLLWLLVLLPKWPPAGPPAAALSRCSAQEYQRARAATPTAALPKPTFPVKKSRGRLVLPLSKGHKVFSDVRKADDETATATYQYLGYIEQLQHHLLQVQLWERSEYAVVDAKGKVTSLWSPPVYSPQLKYLATVSGSLAYEMMPNGLQLFRCGPGGLQRVWELAATTWEPVEEGAFWASENTLYVKQKRYPNQDISKKATYTYAKLTIR